MAPFKWTYLPSYASKMQETDVLENIFFEERALFTSRAILM